MMAVQYIPFIPNTFFTSRYKNKSNYTLFQILSLQPAKNKSNSTFIPNTFTTAR